MLKRRGLRGQPCLIPWVREIGGVEPLLVLMEGLTGSFVDIFVNVCEVGWYIQPGHHVPHDVMRN